MQKLTKLKKLPDLFRKHLFYLFIIIILLPSFLSLLKPGFFSMYDDMQVIRLQQMDKCIRDLQIPCRWVPDLGYGYGYPLYQYYSPAPYYFMEIFHLFGVSLIDSVKIGFIASIVLSFVFTYKLSRYFLNKKPSVFAAVVYTYLPFRAADLYVRGAMGESWGLFALPAYLWSFEYFAKNNNKKSFTVFTVFTALLLTTHNLTLLMSIPLITAWLLTRIYFSKNRKQTFKGTLSASLVGLLLSSFFVIPLFFERKEVYLETLTQGYFNYLAHFLSIKQLFLSFHWGYGPSVLGAVDDVFLGLGPIHFFLAISGAVSLLFSRVAKEYKITLYSLFIIMFAALFMSHEKSTPIWKAFEFLSILQFPWRFILIAGFCASLLSGALLQSFPRRMQGVFLVIMTLGIFYFYIPYFQPKDWFAITDSQKLSGELYQKQITASIYDYLPKSATALPLSEAPDAIYTTTGALVVSEFKKGTNWYDAKVEVLSTTADVIFPSYDFPGWKVWVNNTKAPVIRSGDLGLVSVDLPTGEHEVFAKLTRTWPRKLGDSLSILGILTLIVINRKNLRLQ
jgi:hypothetical protein